MARILAVEDSKTVQHYIKTILSRAGHEVLSCYDGGQALDVARFKQPELMLLDLQLPQRSGWLIARDCQRDSRLRHLPIIVVSGVDDRAQMRDLLKLGNVCSYVAKPFSSGTLQSEVSRVLEQQARARVHAAS